MKGMKNPKPQAGNRYCNRCNMEFPATAEFFVSDASRALGLAYECRACLSERKIGRDQRSDRWGLMTAEQKVKVRARQLKYGRSAKGRAVFLRQAYRRIDACDMTSQEVLAIIERPCHYCGTTTEPRGLDRIDNALAHVKGNVLPACLHCNFARGDRLTVAEMLVVGHAIRQVLDSRAKATENEGRL